MMRELIGRKVRVYLGKKLRDGQHELVYGLSSYWGSRQGLGRWNPFYDAAWFFQERLIREFGYHECPSCYWATHRPENHSTWCKAEIESRENSE